VTAMAPDLRVTNHALERWRERVGGGYVPPQHVAMRLRLGVTVPTMKARTAWPGLTAAGDDAQVVATASAVAVVREDRVITVVELGLLDLATVLTWLLTGSWVDEVHGDFTAGPQPA
jgi:hypothetical protein